MVNILLSLVNNKIDVSDQHSGQNKTNLNFVKYDFNNEYCLNN